MGRPPKKQPKHLSASDLKEIVRLVGDGMPQSWAAESLGYVKQVVPMRCRRDEAVRVEITQAKAKAKIEWLRRMLALAEKTGQWQAYAWVLQRWGGVSTPTEEAQLEVLRARAEAIRAGLPDGGDMPAHDPRFE